MKTTERWQDERAAKLEADRDIIRRINIREQQAAIFPELVATLQAYYETLPSTAVKELLARCEKIGKTPCS